MKPNYASRAFVALVIGAGGYVAYWLMSGTQWSLPKCAGSALASLVAVQFALVVARMVKQGWSS